MSFHDEFLFGIEESELKEINTVSKLLDRSVSFDKMGSWGILPFICGALEGQTLSGKSCVLEGFPSSYEIISNFISGIKPATEIAMDFSKFIKEWANDESSKILAKKRLDDIFRYENTAPSQVISESYILYLTLAIMLNSLSNLDGIDDFDIIKKWASAHAFGWERLFFSAGLLLSNDKDVKWEKYGQCILSFSGEHKDIAKQLFDKYRRCR